MALTVPPVGDPERPGRRVSTAMTGRTASDAPAALVAGVATRLARRLGASVLVLRVAFGVLALAGGVGVVLYALLWALGVDEPTSPRPRTLRHDLGVVAGSASVLMTVFVSMDSVPPQLIVPLAFVAFASALSAGPAVGADLTAGRAFGRIAVGMVLMLGGLIAGAAALGDLGDFWAIGAASAAVVVGLAVVLAPWLRHLIDGASADRSERIRAEARADIAAHLHDSVLQTLTLIQNRAHEPQVASALAHQQERELRKWLYEQSGDQDARVEARSLRTELAAAVADIEDDYLVVIDLVAVGDAPLTPKTRAVVGAMREAMVNAAKFAGTRQISAYLEVDAERMVAFVRDRGVGFDLQGIQADRRGIADSIRARIARVDGAVVVRTAPGAGTEVRLEVPR